MIINGERIELGDTVIYNHPGDATGTFGRKVSPAIIQSIHEDDCVDLFVMTSPTQDDGGHYKAGGGLYFNFRAKHGKNGLEWQTKSEYYEDD